MNLLIKLPTEMILHLFTFLDFETVCKINDALHVQMFIPRQTFVNSDFFEDLTRISSDFLRHCIYYNMKTPSKYRKQIFEMAVETSNFYLVKFLVEDGTEDIFDYIITYTFDLDIIHLLSELGAKFDECFNNNVMVEAAMHGRLDIIKFFIDKQYILSPSVVITAAENGHFKLVKFLADYCTAYEFDKNKVLVIASMYGNFDMVKYMVEKGAYVGENKNEALKAAYINNHNNIIEYLENNSDFYWKHIF